MNTPTSNNLVSVASMNAIQPKAPVFPPPTNLKRSSVPYRIETQRLVIRCYNPTDAPLHERAVSASVEHLRTFMPRANNEPLTIEQRVDLLRRFRGKFDLAEDFIYGVFSKDETELLGGTGFHERIGPDALEISYWVNARHTRRGYATEFTAALTRVAFELVAARKLEIHCDVVNIASAGIPRALGYRHDATLRQAIYGWPAGLRDCLVWSMLKEEFAASPAAQFEMRAYDALGRLVHENSAIHGDLGG